MKQILNFVTDWERSCPVSSWPQTFDEIRDSSSYLWQSSDEIYDFSSEFNEIRDPPPPPPIDRLRELPILHTHTHTALRN